MVVPRPTQPFIPPGSVNEGQLLLERQRQVGFIPFMDKRVGGRENCVKMRVIPECLSDRVSP